MSLNIISIVISVLSFIPAIVFHEVAHGWAANKLGDPTAKSAGRLSLNPLKHLDPFGTVILPGILILMGGPVFGYAKPVPYNPAYFKDPRKGDLIVGLAGPAANLVMAIIGAAIAWLFYLFAPGLIVDNIVVFYVFAGFLPTFVLINLYFMFFNLLPIPPLDGSSIFAVILPPKYLPQYYKIQRYALPILFIVVFGVPYLFSMFGLNFNPLHLYLNVTADNLARLLLPMNLWG